VGRQTLEKLYFTFILLIYKKTDMERTRGTIDSVSGHEIRRQAKIDTICMYDY